MRQAERAGLGDMVEDDVGAERAARVVGRVEGIDQRQAVGEPVGEAGGVERPEPAVSSGAAAGDIRRDGCRYGCPRPSWRSRATTCRPCRPRDGARRDRPGTAKNARWSAWGRRSRRRGRRWRASPAAGWRWAEIVDQHPHRDAGAATFAGGAVGDRLRAAEAGLGQEVVQRGGALADEMGEDLPFLLAGQVWARRRRGQIELRGVAHFPGHAFATPLCRTTRRARTARRGIPCANRRRISQAPHDHDLGEDVVQAPLLRIDQRNQEDRREEPAHVEQNRVHRRIDERNALAACCADASRGPSRACPASPSARRIR